MFCLALDLNTIRKIQKVAHGFHQNEIMDLRIAISTGVPKLNGYQLHGAAINLAARLCPHEETGSILVASLLGDLSG